MADEQNQQGQQGGGSSSEGTQNTGNMIPQSRFNEVLERARKAEEALVKHQTDSHASEQERLKKQGEWQTIAENATKEADSLKAFKTRAETLESTIKAGNEARIALVPETMRKLIPVNYPPEHLQTWLNDNWSLLTVKPAPDIDAGAGGGGGTRAVILTDEQKAVARAMNMTPEAYAKRLQEIQQRGE